MFRARHKLRTVKETVTASLVLKGPHPTLVADHHGFALL